MTNITTWLRAEDEAARKERTFDETDLAEHCDKAADLIETLLSLVKEARRDAVNDRDALYELVTNEDGEYTDPADGEEVAELDDFIRRLVAGIARAEGA